MIRSEKMILKKTEEVDRWLQEATAIYNQCLYHFRQECFGARDEKRKPDYDTKKIYSLVKESEAWKTSTLDYNVMQQVFKKVKETWFSFLKAKKAYWKDRSKFLGEPKLPRYLKNGRTAILLFDKSRLRKKDLVNNRVCLPKSKYHIQLPKHVSIPKIRCVIVKAYYRKVKVAISYEKDVTTRKLDSGRYLGIDLGVENIVSMTTDNGTGRSWIVKGGAVKSINQFYNKRIAELKSILEKTNGRKTSRRI